MGHLDSFRVNFVDMTLFLIVSGKNRCPSCSSTGASSIPVVANRHESVVWGVVFVGD